MDISNVKILMYIMLALGMLILLYSILDDQMKKRSSVLRAKLSNHSDKNIVDRFLDSISFIVEKEKETDAYLKMIEIKYTARTLTKYRLIGILVGLYMAYYLKNWMVVMPLSLTFAFLPMFVIEAAIERKHIKFNMQFAESLQLFTAEYTTSLTIQEALFNILPKLKKPIKYEFERLYKRLVSGEKIEECFMDFARRINNKDAMIFAQLMITNYKKGGDVSPHLNTIVSSIIGERVMKKKNKMELSGVRTINIIINALVPVAYIINKMVNPATTSYFTDTPNGKFIIFFIATSSFASLYLGKRISKAN